VIPVYGFLEGDTIGLLVLLDDEDTVADAIAKLQSAAAVRVTPREGMVLVHGGRLLAPATSVADAQIEPLDRVDVLRAGK
jgi:Toluene-4-monooxygenase system protein B (TmoB)